MLPLLVHQRNANRMAFRWWADSGPRLNAGWIYSALSAIKTGRSFAKYID